MTEEASETISPESDESQERQAADEQTGSGPRLLIVDDDNSIRLLLKHFLTKSGFQVEQAENGQEAIGILESSQIDLVLMDIEMPVMDGVRTLATIRRTPATQNLPVIMLSGQASVEYVKKCISLGAKSFVVKQGLKPEVVTQRVKEALAPPDSKDATNNDSAAPPDIPIEFDEPPIDQTAWKEKMESIGRVAREQTREITTAAELPVIFPGVHDDIREAMESNSSESDDLIRAAEQDPAVVLATIKTANNSQESSNTRAADLETALSWVGNSGVGEVLTKIVEIQSDPASEARPWILRWWRHSFAVSQVAAELALAFGIEQSFARTAGMIHDIGRLLLLSSELGPKAVKAYDLGNKMAIPSVFAEQTLLAMNHKQIGAELCHRYSVPIEIAKICETHDMDDAQRERQEEQVATLSALICAADQLAKASGYGSLVNDELMTLPQQMVVPVNELQVQIERALAEFETLCLWRIGSQPFGPAKPAVILTGMNILLVSPCVSESNPFRLALSKAGAAVTMFAEVKEVLDIQPSHDALIVDYTNTDLNLSMAMLRRLSHQKSFEKIPKLVLTRKADEADDRLGQSGITMNTYSTPIRINSLLVAIKRLTSG